MADYERAILNRYNLTSPYPTEWPTEKDESDASDNDMPMKPLTKFSIRRSKSRYSALERTGSERRSLVPGTERTGDGVENLVQKDEADPLGDTDSVVRVLRQRGLPVEDDLLLRNRFLLSSTTFSPTLYLSQVHSDASTQSLSQGLEYLSRSIDQKSASLKVLVESNFERFVRAKTTIDNVYSEMRNQGSEPKREKVPTPRITSRGSMHFRKASGQGPLTPSKGNNKPLPSDKEKNALVKDSEYGVLGIKAPLIEAAVKAEEIWGPALGGQDHEENLKLTLNSVDRFHAVFKAGATISDCIKRKDYENLVKEYTRARKSVDEARDIADTVSKSQASLTESQIHQMVITGRMWIDVEEQIGKFKRDVWRKLANVTPNPASSTNRKSNGEHMTLIGILLELGVEDNPIWVWLLSRYDHLKNKINATFERSRVEIEILRRRLANAEKPSSRTIATHLKSSTRNGPQGNTKNLDTGPVLELWDLIYASMSNMLSIQGGLLGEVVDFWDKAQSFIDGKAQKALPIGIDGRSLQHHRLSSDGTRHLQNGAVELIELIRESVSSFFSDPPIEDVSLLYSPMPPLTPKTPKSAAFSPFAHQDNRFKFDANNPPPPSPRRGEAWEEFAFWPPHANSLSGVHYLGKLLNLLGTAAGEMAAMRSGSSASGISEKLKALVAGVRERSARAICAAWNIDAEMCKELEDWTRDNDRRDLTKMPSHFSAFEEAILSGLQKVLYISEAVINKSGSADVISPPPSKLLQIVRTQFVTSLYKALSGMVENAEKPGSSDGDSWVTSADSLANRFGEIQKGSVPSASTRNMRMLLTLSNLKALQADIVPQLIHQFETNFSVKLTEESKTIQDVLTQIDTRLFQSYIRPTEETLSSIIHAGITSQNWPPTTTLPIEVRPYVYQALLHLVSIHASATTTTPPLTPRILSHLLDSISASLQSAFQTRPKYNLAALMQATLDTEFFAQTLSQYTTSQAAETQSRIYLELDARTDNDARAGLQRELPVMKGVLKRLREGTRVEFACFRKVRGGK